MMRMVMVMMILVTVMITICITYVSIHSNARCIDLYYLRVRGICLALFCVFAPRAPV